MDIPAPPVMSWPALVLQRQFTEICSFATLIDDGWNGSSLEGSCKRVLQHSTWHCRNLIFNPVNHQPVEKSKRSK